MFWRTPVVLGHGAGFGCSKRGNNFFWAWGPGWRNGEIPQLIWFLRLLLPFSDGSSIWFWGWFLFPPCWPLLITISRNYLTGQSVEFAKCLTRQVTQLNLKPFLLNSMPSNSYGVIYHTLHSLMKYSLKHVSKFGICDASRCLMFRMIPTKYECS